MKISWMSNAPWVPSGYGTQTALFTPRLAALGHDVSMLAYVGLKGRMIKWAGLPVYPAGNDTYSEDVIKDHCQYTEAELFISLMDIWVLDPAKWPGVRWAPWTPVDTEPIAPPILGRMQHAAHPLVFSRHGLAECRQNDIDAEYIPLCVDTKAMAPMDQNAARDELKWPQDRYIVGIVADNRSGADRKSWPEHIEAFARFRKKHTDAMLYVHTQLDHLRGGFDLGMLCKIHGLTLGEDVIFPDPYIYQLGLPPAYMRRMYASCDVLLAASYGEGFGLPIVEAQACGTPVIVGAWTSMDELCFAGVKIAKDEAEPVYRGTHGYMFKPRIGAIAAALQRMWKQSGSELLAGQARRGALEYDADAITERYWKPVLDKIEHGIRHVPLPEEVAGAL